MLFAMFIYSVVYVFGFGEVNPFTGVSVRWNENTACWIFCFIVEKLSQLLESFDNVFYSYYLFQSSSRFIVTSYFMFRCLFP